MAFNEKVIEEFRQFMVLEQNKSWHTVDNYTRDLEQFDRFLDGKDFRKVEPFGIAGFIRELRDQGMKPQTTNRKLSTFKTFYKYLKSHGHVQANPTEGVSGAKQEQPLPKPVDIEDIELIFDSIPDSDLRAKVIFEILYATGARRFEVAKIRVKDINFNRQYISILGKGGKERTVPINEYALVLIKKLIVENANGEWLFPSRQYPGKSISPRRINEIVTEYVRKAGFEKESGITPHKFRHSFCSHLYENGADLKTIQAFAGHSKADTTNGYTKLADKRALTEYTNAHPRAKKQA